MSESPRTVPETASDRLAGLADASNILVCSASGRVETRRACAELFRAGDAAATNALVITYLEGAGRWIDQYGDVASDRPENLVVVGVGDDQPNGRQESVGVQPIQPAEPTIDSVTNPGDLTGLGIKITEYLRKFDSDRWGGGPTDVVMCFDSLTTLLQYTEVSSAFRLLHTITGRVRGLDATAHYHLTPEAHDEQTLSTLRSLFDARLDVGGADLSEWTVREF